MTSWMRRFITERLSGIIIFGIFGSETNFCKEQDDIYIMLEWDQINIHLKDLLSSGYLGDAIRTWKVKLPHFSLLLKQE